MIIRPAIIPLDMFHILPGARAFAAALPDDAKEGTAAPGTEIFDNTIWKMAMVPGVVIQLALTDSGEQAFGGIGYMISPSFWNCSRIAIEELFWWVYPGAPRKTAWRLFDMAFKDAKDKGATFATFSLLDNSPAGVERMYRRYGLSPLPQKSFVGVI